MKKTLPMDFSTDALAVLAKRDAARALREDVGAGDLSAALVEPQRQAYARVVARETAVICGAPWVGATFQQLDPQATLTWHVAEGARCAAGQLVFEVRGLARALLSGERTALNFLQTLSAVASQTSRYVERVREVAGAHAQIVDTRKTLPGLRLAEKYAVRSGGGTNHRLGLFDAVLIKENHIVAAGGVAQALQRVSELASAAKFIEIEVEDLTQLETALIAGATMVLLDNMNLAQLHEAVRLTAGRAILEVSGGVDLSRVAAIAATGVDRISIGALTKDIKAIDFSMRFTASPV